METRLVDIKLKLEVILRYYQKFVVVTYCFDILKVVGDNILIIIDELRSSFVLSDPNLKQDESPSHLRRKLRLPLMN